MIAVDVNLRIVEHWRRTDDRRDRAGIVEAGVRQSAEFTDHRKVIVEAVAGPRLTLGKPWGEAVIVAMGVLSFLLTPEYLRRANGFSWAPILEVAVLFVGIFICMVPALELLRKHGLGPIFDPRFVS